MVIFRIANRIRVMKGYSTIFKVARDKCPLEEIWQENLLRSKENLEWNVPLETFSSLGAQRTFL